MMLLLALVATFVTVVATGPAGREYRERRRALRDAPLARVLYLPSGACWRRTDDVTARSEP